MREMPPLYRVPASLPCMVPVLPGTCETDHPSEQRTETCSVDAWFMLGSAMICDVHVVALFGEPVDWGGRPPPEADLPWDERHRYDQNPDVLPDGHPCKKAAA